MQQPLQDFNKYGKKAMFMIKEVYCAILYNYHHVCMHLFYNKKDNLLCHLQFHIFLQVYQPFITKSNLIKIVLSPVSEIANKRYASSKGNTTCTLLKDSKYFTNSIKMESYSAIVFSYFRSAISTISTLLKLRFRPKIPDFKVYSTIYITINSMIKKEKLC